MATDSSPRIGRHNYKALERAISQPSLFGDEPSDIPWVIVDGTWATPDSPLLGRLRSVGVHVIVDTQAWRFCDARTWEVGKFGTQRHKPDAPLTLDSVDAFVDFVKADIAWQLMLGADAVFLPGMMPKKDSDAGTRGLSVAADVALTSDIAPGIPIVGFLGAHSQSLDEVRAFAAEPTISLLSGVYVQVSPIDPMTDSVSKLIDVAQVMLRFEDAGVPVVAGHLGAFGGVLRSLGVAAADAGLGSGETFDANRLVGLPKHGEGKPTGGGTSARRYVSQLLRSVSPSHWSALMSLGVARGFLDCRLKCCRSRTIEDRTQWAREHSLRSRVAESADLAGLPPTMRAARQVDVIHAARASLVMVNTALREDQGL